MKCVNPNTSWHDNEPAACNWTQSAVHNYGIWPILFQYICIVVLHLQSGKHMVDVGCNCHWTSIGQLLSPEISIDIKDCQCEQSIFKTCVFSSLAFVTGICVLKVMCWGVVSGAENKAILWHKGEKTYLPDALHWVCHKIQASTVRSREVFGQWEKTNFEQKAESNDLHMIIKLIVLFVL